MAPMRERYDSPSPLERMCAKALGVAEASLGDDTALIDFIGGGGDGAAAVAYVPPPDFYERLAPLLEAWEQERYELRRSVPGAHHLGQGQEAEHPAFRRWDLVSAA